MDITLNDITTVVTHVRWIPFTVLSYKLSNGTVKYLDVDEAKRIFGPAVVRRAQRQSTQWMEL